MNWQATPRPNLLLDLGRALIADGAAHAAIGVCEQLLERSELAEATRITALGQLARAAFIAGQVELAETCFENAVGLAEESHRDLTLQALLDHAFFRLVDGPRPPLPLLERARRLAARPPAPLGACAEAAWGGMAYPCGDGRGLAVAEKAAESAGFKSTPAAGGVHWAWDPVIIYAQLCTWTERFAKAERLFREVLERAERLGEPMLIANASFTWMDCLCRQGRLEDALGVSDQHLELAELVPFILPLSAAYRAMVLVQMGRLDEASSWLERLRSLPAGGRRLYLAEGTSLRLRGAIALRTGDLAVACRCFTELERQAVAWGLLDPCHIPWAGDAVDAYLASGCEADAQRVIASLESRAEATPSRWPGLIAALGRAILAERSGDRALAEERFASALGLQTDMPLARAQTLTAYGAFLNRGGGQRPGGTERAPGAAQADRSSRHCYLHGRSWFSRRRRTRKITNEAAASARKAAWARAWSTASGEPARAASSQTTAPQTELTAMAERSGLTQVDAARTTATKPTAGSSQANAVSPGTTSPKSSTAGTASARTAIVRSRISRSAG